MNDAHIVNLINIRDQMEMSLHSLSMQMLACGYEKGSDTYINCSYRNLMGGLSDARLFSDELVKEYMKNEQHTEEGL